MPSHHIWNNNIDSKLENSLFIVCKGIYLEQKGCKKEPYICKDHLLMNKIIIENRRSKQKNLSMNWIDYKKTFDKQPHKWILKVWNPLKIFPHSKNIIWKDGILISD